VRRLAAIALLPLLLAALAWAAGSSPLAALQALGGAAFGDAYAVHSVTLVRWAPLALAGLAAAVAFQAGVWNIGVEGQLLAGAVAAFAAAQAAGPVAGLAAGAAAGAAYAGLAAVWMTRFAAPVVIVTLMLNFIAELFLSLLVNGPLQEPTHIYPQSAPLMAAARLPVWPGTRLHLGVALAALALTAGWVVLYRTVAGFRLRLAGAGPRAAAFAGGLDVGRVRAAALVASGALAGLAGAGELLGVTGVLYERFSPGYGFTAIAVALAAALHPLGIFVSALFFAALEAGAAGLQRDAGIPAGMTFVLEGAAVIVSLWALRAGARREEG
jgi:simple sugar transport system permease protein